MTGLASAGGAGPIAIICGAGNFPYAVADAVIGRGRHAVLFALRGFADPVKIERYRHHWCHVGQIGRFLRLARAEGCEEIVFIGSLVRPAIGQLRLDWTTIRLLPRIVTAYKGGDKHLLSGVGQIAEHLGFRLFGAHELAPDILVPEGKLGMHAPTQRDRADITHGMLLLAAMGRFDIGQAAVIAAHRVVAVEAAEGTDRMLGRVADLRRGGLLRLSGKAGVLVKAPKPDQDRRFDLPSVGAHTVEAAAAAGLAGIALEANGAISADLQDMIRTADEFGLFLVGMAPAAAASDKP